MSQQVAGNAFGISGRGAVPRVRQRLNEYSAEES